MKLVVAAWVVAIASWSSHDHGGDGAGRAFDFATDVLPFLQRHGCASAYCHGGATGQGGFKLSLFGSDPLADYGAITDEFGGRRVDLASPERSLLLQKGLGRLDHGGGRRLPRDGEAVRVLREWIAAGAPWQRGPRRPPPALTLQRHGDQLLTTAAFGAESVDVTDRAMFSSSDPRVVVVDEGGRVQEVGPGRAFLIARFATTTATLAVTRPFAAVAAPPAAPASGLERAWAQHLGELGLQPIAMAAPERLARRLHLDLVGRPPTPHELQQFVAAPDVERTVRALAARREFAVVWGEHLARWFELPANGTGLRQALVLALARGDGLARIAARIAGGELPLIERLPDPRDRAEYAARTLLGLQLGCARCHDHPEDRWRQPEHLAFSAAFAPARPAADGGMAPGVLFDEATGQPVAPRWLALDGGGTAPPTSFAGFLLGPGQDQLARNLANRVFAELLGRGLVEPVDDHRTGNPPAGGTMLQELVAAFTRTDGQLAELLVVVMTSRLYALESAPNDDPRPDWLAARRPTSLSPAAFARAVAAVVGRDPRGPLPDEPLARELALRNGAFVHELLAAGGTTIDALFDLGGSAHERLDELWRTLLSRAPRDDEIAAFLPLAGQDRAAFRDLAMAVLLGREFGQRR
jgi:Protein of unknown function (DUF1553)/Protein of unknown function (DUF1549)